MSKQQDSRDLAFLAEVDAALRAPGLTIGELAEAVRAVFARDAAEREKEREENREA